MADYYAQEDVQQILHLAIARKTDKGEFSRSQLVEMANELGISSDRLAEAEHEWLAHHGEFKERQAFDTFRSTRLKNNVIRYAIVNSFLVLLNLATAHALTWSLPIVFLWGLFLALKVWRTYELKGEDYEKAFASWRLKQQIGNSINTTLTKWLKPQEGSV
ncbi:2TM domain-containing protein [Phormidium sp. CCY1219]|uniref:2TM domain-containing protein n=1 Tax=Phormidium sp. CCY1219 TaxID=2886104 RepID=UPI002D1EF4F5|nr:2TM domain-containing protein [Phormidium sp. CCY1219]MEB3827131.1 2TM domain-containing protein [Phormidium sp. CCY1219]